MSEMKKTFGQVTALEELAGLNSPFHRIQASAKIIVTVIYLVMVISWKQGEVSGLLPYILYPVIVTALAELPIRLLFRRLVVALPFTVLAGLSNLFLSREIVFSIGSIGITEGMMSFCSLLIKSLLTVMAVLLLIATTRMDDLSYALLRFHIPSIFVMQFMMMYRYLFVLMEEASVMYHAYILRAPREKGIKLKDMGPFIGQLVIRSIDRAERVYHAMKCRGFSGNITLSDNNRMSKMDWFYLLLVGGLFLFMRLINLSEWIGRMYFKILS